MTFPAVTSVTNSGAASFTTTPPVAMPATVDAGDLLLVHLSSGVNSAGAAPSGWTSIGASGGNPGVYYKIASGSEDGTTVNFNQGNGWWAAQCFRITGWHGSSAPEISTLASGVSNAPNALSVTPSWGSDDNLFIALVSIWHAFGTDRTLSGYPGSYTSTTPSDPGGFGGQVLAGSGWRQLAASSDDPSAFALSGSIDWAAATIVVRPAGAAGGQPTTKRFGGVLHAAGGPRVLGVARWFRELANGQKSKRAKELSYGQV